MQWNVFDGHIEMSDFKQPRILNLNDNMKKKILRNIAIVSAIFIVTFSIMLIVNYFQVRGTTPLQTAVVETLKEINDQNANNTALQEQIRQLDLLARKAYFVRMEYLMTGVYILLGMLAVFIICTRFFYAKDMDIPDKDIDPIDEWAVKSKARKYVVWVATGIAAIALVFVFLSTPFMKSGERQTKTEIQETDDAATPEIIEIYDDVIPGEVSEATEQPISTNEISNTAEDITTETSTSEAPPQPVVSKVTHNAFRGNNSSGISSAKGLPVQWDLRNGANIAWKKDIPRKGYNSPVINGNKVFFTGADEEARELYCHDLTTGEQLWSLAAVNIPGSPQKLPDTSDDTGLAASSAATDGTRVCAIFATGDIICADMNGKQIWAKNLGVPEINYGFSSSLLIYGNMVIIQYDQSKTAKVLALDLATGAERWNKNRTDKYGTWSTPMITTVNNAPQLILMGTPGITAYNPNSGEQIWRLECMPGAEIAASACSADGLVFAAGEHAKMVAINGSDGSLLWESNEYLPEVASPVANTNNLYIATTYGVVASFDTKTGELRKEHDLETSFYSSPVIADGKIYLIGIEGKICIFSADDEFRLLHSFETGENTFATPAFTDGRIVIRTEKSIYCVENK